MSDLAKNDRAEMPQEDVLGDALVRGDSALATATPILRHLIDGSASSLFSDEIIARIRGMSSSAARQLLSAEAIIAGEQDPQKYIGERQAELVAVIMANDEFLAHCQALAVEYRLTEQLEAREAIDPVLTPIVQALISSDDNDTSSAAMAALTAQARFMQSQRRMELSIGELPGELFHALVVAWRAHSDKRSDAIAANAEQQLRSEYNEAAGRLGLLSRLYSGMGNGARAGLSLGHAGVAIFLTTLAAKSGQDRALTALSTDAGQASRLGLSLCAAGLRPHEIEEQFVHIHPLVDLPGGLDGLPAKRAAELLAGSTVKVGA